jgi:hypothetical protein
MPGDEWGEQKGEDRAATPEDSSTRLVATEASGYAIGGRLTCSWRQELARGVWRKRSRPRALVFVREGEGADATGQSATCPC